MKPNKYLEDVLGEELGKGQAKEPSNNPLPNGINLNTFNSSYSQISSYNHEQTHVFSLNNIAFGNFGENVSVEFRKSLYEKEHSFSENANVSITKNGQIARKIDLEKTVKSECEMFTKLYGDSTKKIAELMCDEAKRKVGYEIEKDPYAHTGKSEIVLNVNDIQILSKRDCICDLVIIKKGKENLELRFGQGDCFYPDPGGVREYVRKEIFGIEGRTKAEENALSEYLKELKRQKDACLRKRRYEKLQKYIKPIKLIAVSGLAGGLVGGFVGGFIKGCHHIIDSTPNVKEQEYQNIAAIIVGCIFGCIGAFGCGSDYYEKLYNK